MEEKDVFLLFVDDYFRIMRVYFMEKKSEALTYFMQFEGLIENGHSLKILKAYRGGEFTSNEFNNFYKKYEIKRELTSRCTSQQNGVAKRKSCNIAEMALNMIQITNNIDLNDIGPKPFTSQYIILNKSPTKQSKL